MPLYDCECQACQHVHEQIFRMAESPGPCPKCGSKNVAKTFLPSSVPKTICYDRGWESENGGLGRYANQFDTELKGVSKDTCFRSRREMIEAAHKKFPHRKVIKD